MRKHGARKILSDVSVYLALEHRSSCLGKGVGRLHVLSCLCTSPGGNTLVAVVFASFYGMSRPQRL